MNPSLSGFVADTRSAGARVDLARAGLERAAARPADGAAGSDRARATAKEFEAMMLEEMLGRVFESVGDVGFFGEAGPGAGMYRSMLVKEYSGMIAQSGGVGFADQVYAEILKLQEAS